MSIVRERSSIECGDMIVVVSIYIYGLLVEYERVTQGAHYASEKTRERSAPLALAHLSGSERGLTVERPPPLPWRADV